MCGIWMDTMRAKKISGIKRGAKQHYFVSVALVRVYLALWALCEFGFVHVYVCVFGGHRLLPKFRPVAEKRPGYGGKFPAHFFFLTR